MAVSGRGGVFAFHRASRHWTDPLPLDPIRQNTLVELEAETGRIVRQLGAGLFAMPHGLALDPAENLWVTDVATHQVMKLSPDGRVILTLGTRGVPGVDEKHFDRPTDVLVRPDGGFYVSDGYGNARILMFDRNGGYKFEWGTAGSGPGQFRTPHSLAFTSDGLVTVADRNNGRLQFFDARGRYVREWRLPDGLRPYSVAAMPGRRLVVVANGPKAAGGAETAAGLIIEETGAVVSRFGGHGRADGQFLAVHDVAADGQGALYAINVTDGRLQKFAVPPPCVVARRAIASCDRASGTRGPG